MVINKFNQLKYAQKNYASITCMYTNFGGCCHSGFGDIAITRITRGYPRQHVWSFASGWVKSSCPCHTSAAIYRQPSFVGEDYFCEVVSGGTYSKGLYSELMWDGVGCSGSTCCHRSSTMPWFKNDLSVPSTDVLELRAVCDTNFGDEDIVIASYAIYVQ